MTWWHLQKKKISMQAWCRHCSFAPVIKEILILSGFVNIWPSHCKVNSDGFPCLIVHHYLWYAYCALWTWEKPRRFELCICILNSLRLHKVEGHCIKSSSAKSGTNPLLIPSFRAHEIDKAEVSYSHWNQSKWGVSGSSFQAGVSRSNIVLMKSIHPSYTDCKSKPTHSNKVSGWLKVNLFCPRAETHARFRTLVTDSRTTVIPVV